MAEMTKAAVGSGGRELSTRVADNYPHAHSSRTGRGAQVYVGERVVGQVRGDVFQKAAYGSKHMLRRPPAWALDLRSLDEAERLGALSVSILDRESGLTYRASVNTIRRDGRLFNRGHGEQVWLALDRWVVTRPGEVRAQQLTLFGEVTV